MWSQCSVDREQASKVGSDQQCIQSKIWSSTPWIAVFQKSSKSKSITHGRWSTCNRVNTIILVHVWSQEPAYYRINDMASSIIFVVFAAAVRMAQLLVTVDAGAFFLSNADTNQKEGGINWNLDEWQDSVALEPPTRVHNEIIAIIVIIFRIVMVQCSKCIIASSGQLHLFVTKIPSSQWC